MKKLKSSVRLALCLVLCLPLCLQIAEAKKSKKGKKGDIVEDIIESLLESDNSEESSVDAMVTVRSSHVRNYPNQSGKSIGELISSQVVSVTGCSAEPDYINGKKGHWCHVTYKNGSGCSRKQEGWVWGWNMALI